MHPILLEIGPFKLPSYGLTLVLTFVIAAWLMYREAPRHGLQAQKSVDAAVIAFLFGVLGAKLLLILIDPGYYLEDPRRILDTIQSAGVIYGGIIGGILGGAWYIRRHKLPLWATLDLMAPFAGLGLGLGRLGCLSAGCCYGYHPYDGPLALTFPNHPYCEAPAGIPTFPVQLVGLLVGFFLFAVLLILLRRKSFHGQVLAVLIFLYSVTRGLVEMLRGDSIRGMWFGDTLSTSQIIAIVGTIVAVVVYFQLKKRAGNQLAKESVA